MAGNGGESPDPVRPHVTFILKWHCVLRASLGRGVCRPFTGDASAAKCRPCRAPWDCLRLGHPPPSLQRLRGASQASVPVPVGCLTRAYYTLSTSSCRCVPVQTCSGVSSAHGELRGGGEVVGALVQSNPDPFPMLGASRGSQSGGSVLRTRGALA